MILTFNLFGPITFLLIAAMILLLGLPLFIFLTLNAKLKKTIERLDAMKSEVMYLKGKLDAKK